MSNFTGNYDFQILALQIQIFPIKIFGAKIIIVVRVIHIQG